MATKQTMKMGGKKNLLFQFVPGGPGRLPTEKERGEKGKSKDIDLEQLASLAGEDHTTRGKGGSIKAKPL